MRKPKLLYKGLQGAVIYSYDIEGGKTTCERFLGCIEGSCSFYNTMDDAKRAVKILT